MEKYFSVVLTRYEEFPDSNVSRSLSITQEEMGGEESLLMGFIDPKDGGGVPTKRSAILKIWWFL